MPTDKQKKSKQVKEPKDLPVKRKRRSKKEKVKIEKKITREQKIETLKTHAREFEFVYRPNVIDLKKNAEECKKATEGTCWRPDIYLNNDRTCDNCVLSEHCACVLKRFSTKRKKRNE